MFSLLYFWPSLIKKCFKQNGNLQSSSLMVVHINLFFFCQVLTWLCPEFVLLSFEQKSWSSEVCIFHLLHSAGRPKYKIVTKINITMRWKERNLPIFISKDLGFTSYNLKFKYFENEIHFQKCISINFETYLK